MILCHLIQYAGIIQGWIKKWFVRKPTFERDFLLLLFYYSCPNFFPFAILHPAHPPLPESIPTPLSMFVGHSYIFFDQSLPLLSTIIPVPHPSNNCQSAPCFHASGSVLLISLFYSLFYSPLMSESIWYLSFTDWLISLSIIISSSNHAVAKGKNSFFLLYGVPLCQCTTVF